jgi:hypothetical protein
LRSRKSWRPARQKNQYGMHSCKRKPTPMKCWHPQVNGRGDDWPEHTVPVEYYLCSFTALRKRIVGERDSVVSQPTACVFIRSHAITFCSLWPHSKHSNERCSNPSGPSSTAAVASRVLQLGQRRRVTGKSSRSNVFRMGRATPAFGEAADLTASHASILGYKHGCRMPS